MSLPRRLLAVTFAAALTLGAGACSSSGKSETSTGGQSGEQSSSDAAKESKDAAQAAKDADKALGAGGCYQAAAAYGAIIAKPMELQSKGASQADIDAYQKQIEDLRKNVDEKIRDDYDVLAKAYTEYAKAISGVNLSDPSQLMNPDVQKKLKDASDALDTDAVKKAQQNIEDYFKSCETKLPGGNG